MLLSPNSWAGHPSGGRCMPVLLGDTRVTADTLCCVMPALPRVFDVACPSFGGVCQAGTLCFLWECFFAQGTSVSLQLGRGLLSCQLGSQCLCHCCSSMPPACLAPCHQLLLHGEPPDPQPHVHCLAPPVSRETLDFQRQLCHENIFTVGCWGAVCPREHFGGISCS